MKMSLTTRKETNVNKIVGYGFGPDDTVKYKVKRLDYEDE